MGETNKNIAEKLVTVAENVPKVYEAGREAEWSDFWDAFQDYGNRTSYMRAFGWWKNEAYNPKYAIKGADLNGTFYFSEIVDTKVDIDTSNEKNAAIICNYMFQNCYYLETVRKIITKKSDTYTGTFANCTLLKNITFEGEIGTNIDFHWSPLKKASIENIISVLSSEATGKTLTLKETAVNTAFETAEGLADGSTSAEWLALRGTKTNWTISLA